MEQLFDRRWIVSKITREEHRKPYVQYASKEEAIEEAKRLSKYNPGQQFGVFEMQVVFSAPVEVFEYRVKDSFDPP